MRIIFTLFILLFISSSANSENNYFQDEYFYVGKMDSYNKDFTLYFKTRQKKEHTIRNKKHIANITQQENKLQKKLILGVIQSYWFYIMEETGHNK